MGRGPGSPAERRAVLCPQVGSHRDISLQSLALFRLLEPRIGTARGTGWGWGCPPPLPLGAPSGLCLPLCHLCLVAEILVLGTGDRVEQLHPAVLRQMRLCGIAVEVQDTVRRDPSPWLPALSAQ